MRVFFSTNAGGLYKLIGYQSFLFVVVMFSKSKLSFMVSYIHKKKCQERRVGEKPGTFII